MKNAAYDTEAIKTEGARVAGEKAHVSGMQQVMTVEIKDIDEWTD